MNVETKLEEEPSLLDIDSLILTTNIFECLPCITYYKTQFLGNLVQLSKYLYQIKKLVFIWIWREAQRS